MTGPGSLERIASLLGNGLAPLAGEVSDPGGLLARLGMALDDDLLAPVAAVATDAVAAAQALASVVGDLDVAISADNKVGITLNGALVIDRLADVINGLTALQAAVSGSVATLTPAQQARVAGLLNGLPDRVIALLVADQLSVARPRLTAVLTLLGLIESRRVEADPDDATFPAHVAVTLHWDRLARFLTNPLSALHDAYGFGAPGFDGTVLLHLLADLMSDRYERADVIAGTGGVGAVLQAPSFAMGVRGAELAIPLRLGVSEPQTREFKFDDVAALKLTFDGKVATGSELRVSPTLRVSVVPPSGTANLSANATLTSGKAGVPVTVLGLTGVAGLSVETIAVTVSLTAAWNAGSGAAVGDLSIGVATSGSRLTLDLADQVGLLRALLPKDALAGNFDLGLDFTAGKVRLRGGVGLTATFPVHSALGPVDVRSVTFGIASGGGSGLPIELSTTLQTSLGPLDILVDRIGLTATLDAPAGGGNLGPISVKAAFRPPTGLGVNLEAGPVQGGGYLSVDPAGNRYAGVLNFKLSFVAVTAYGIYEPTATGAASFVAVLGIRFWPGIQLSFGFALTGVGGLVGMNRRVDVDLLRERLASGASGNVLFCDDPVKNAPTLLGDLAAFFPPADGSFVIGPTLQIGWLAPIVRLDIALLIELPGPSKIVVLGSIKVLIGADETIALLYLRMDFTGVVDFDQQLISLDAALVNSHALGAFRLTGGMAFRLSYGPNPYILLSIGGFHPRFDPGPLNLPVIARVGAVLNVGAVARTYLRLELYLAFTSNTLQLGAKVEAGLEIGPISAHGFLAFDALIQFRPFAFDIDFVAGFAVEVSDVSLASVDVHGSLTGPGPLVVHAEARVRVLFIKVSGSATIKLGSDSPDQPQPVPSLVAALAPELSRTENLRASGDDADVVLFPGLAVAGVLVSPRGSLTWEQKRAPLKTLVDRFEGVPLGGQHQIELVTPAGWRIVDETDWFSPGKFASLDLKAAQTLNNATFQELPSGVRFDSAKDESAPLPVPYKPKIDLIKRPERILIPGLPVGAYFNPALAACLAERDTTPPVASGPAKVRVAAEMHNVYAADGTEVATMQTPFQAFQLSRLGSDRLACPSADVVVAL